MSSPIGRDRPPPFLVSPRQNSSDDRSLFTVLCTCMYDGVYANLRFVQIYTKDAPRAHARETIAPSSPPIAAREKFFPGRGGQREYLRSPSPRLARAYYPLPPLLPLHYFSRLFFFFFFVFFFYSFFFFKFFRRSEYVVPILTGVPSFSSVKMKNQKALLRSSA